MNEKNSDFKNSDFENTDFKKTDFKGRGIPNRWGSHYDSSVVPIRKSTVEDSGTILHLYV
jgi:uncharacterized protein YjbI with pentapeptide repeats